MTQGWRRRVASPAPCPTCNGKGFSYVEPYRPVNCPDCNGTGRAAEAPTYTGDGSDIPPMPLLAEIDFARIEAKQAEQQRLDAAARRYLKMFLGGELDMPPTEVITHLLGKVGG